MTAKHTPVRLAVYVLLLAVVQLCACASRYRLRLFLTEKGEQHKVKVEQTEYIPARVLNEPTVLEKLVPGNGSSMILKIGGRRSAVRTEQSTLITYDEYFRCRLYAQLPPTPVTDTILLSDNSFVIVLGRYEMKAEDKVYRAQAGHLVIDSLVKNRFYATIDGLYANRTHDTLHLEGQFKVTYR